MEKTNQSISRCTNRINRLVEELSLEKDFIVSEEDCQYTELLEVKGTAYNLHTK